MLLATNVWHVFPAVTRIRPGEPPWSDLDGLVLPVLDPDAGRRAVRLAGDAGVDDRGAGERLRRDGPPQGAAGAHRAVAPRPAERRRPGVAGDRLQHRLPRRRRDRHRGHLQLPGHRRRAARRGPRPQRAGRAVHRHASSPAIWVVVNLLADVGTMLVTPRLQDDSCDERRERSACPSRGRGRRRQPVGQARRASSAPRSGCGARASGWRSSPSSSASPSSARGWRRTGRPSSSARRTPATSTGSCSGPTPSVRTCGRGSCTVAARSSSSPSSSTVIGLVVGTVDRPRRRLQPGPSRQRPDAVRRHHPRLPRAAAAARRHHHARPQVVGDHPARRARR